MPGGRIRVLGYLALARALMSKDPQAPGGHIRDLGLVALAERQCAKRIAFQTLNIRQHRFAEAFDLGIDIAGRHQAEDDRAGAGVEQILDR